MNDLIDPDQKIAIVGLACRFPGAPTPDAFLHNLRGGVHSMRTLSDRELEAEGVPSEVYRRESYVKACYPIDSESFDANYFGYSPAYAEQMDPQQRVLLECAVEALNSAAIDPVRETGRIGVFAGAGLNMHFLRKIASGSLNLNPEDYLSLQFSNDKDYLCTRISYNLNLKGPSIAVQTACSSSLVAVHLACQSILVGECDVAIAGGVTLQAQQNVGYHYVEGGVLSPDGFCRPFDEEARGTVWGNGAGLVILKRLDQAIRERCSIFGVISGSAVNNDGLDKASFTAPSIRGQTEVIQAAQVMAGIEPDQITSIEAHGTGTSLGDPIEIAALKKAFDIDGNRSHSCAIGSVKSNIGHLGAAAGVAALIKTALSIHTRTLFPSIHFRSANPEIGFEDTPFFVNVHTEDWRVAPGALRVAGVSSFGIGGTNAHVIVEEPPPFTSAGGDCSRPQLFVVSAKSSEALDTSSRSVLRHAKESGQSLPDIAFSLAVGRTQFAHRRAILIPERDTAAEALKFYQIDGRSVEETDRARVVFIFSGQGLPSVRAARMLFETESAFREAFSCCSKCTVARLGLSLDHLIQTVEPRDCFSTPIVAEAFRFATSFSIAKLLMSWGIEAYAMVGGGLGELVAACLTNVMDLDDALRIIGHLKSPSDDCHGSPIFVADCAPGRLDASSSGGAKLLAVNAPAKSIIVDAAFVGKRPSERLSDGGIQVNELSRSFVCCGSIDGKEAFAREIDRMKLTLPSIPYVSAVTADWISADQIRSPEHWQALIEKPALMWSAVGRIAESNDAILLEIGGDHWTWEHLFETCAAAFGDRIVAGVGGCQGSRECRDDERPRLMEAVGRLWTKGVRIDWDAFYADRPVRRVPLPSYPFTSDTNDVNRPVQTNGRNGRDLHLPRADQDVQRNLPAKVDRLSAGNGAVDAEWLTRGMSAIWSEIIGRACINADDDFFELGGDSLLASRLVAAVNRLFGLALPTKSLFTSSTFGKFTETVSSCGNPSELNRIAQLMLTVRAMEGSEVEEALRTARPEASVA